MFKNGKEKMNRGKKKTGKRLDRRNFFLLVLWLIIGGSFVVPAKAQIYQCTNAIYFTSNSNTSVYRYTPSSNAVTQVAGTTTAAPSAASAIMANGARLYSVDGASPFDLHYNSGGATNAKASATSSASAVQRNAVAPNGTGYFMVGTAALAGQFYSYSTSGATSTVRDLLR